MNTKAPLQGRFSLMTLLLRAFFFSFLLYGWLAPLLIPPWVSWHHEVPVFAATLMLGLVTFRHRGPEGIPVPRAITIFAALMLLAVIQCLTGILTFAGDAFVVSLYLFLMALSWQIGYAQAYDRDKRQIEKALLAIAILLLTSALASAALALAQALDVLESGSWANRIPSLRRPGAHLGQPIQLGTLLLMGLASLVYLYEKQKL